MRRLIWFNRNRYHHILFWFKWRSFRLLLQLFIFGENLMNLIIYIQGLTEQCFIFANSRNDSMDGRLGLMALLY
ncbi:hypothetical protein MtrunA17_Chr4g0039851 [Medicago truncatula]|uniref:Transmembrane protein n=1 Tax=Medicago truncatula TaxID=3880 RepID=A0A396IDD6_MEDTR|nr:hypothetical protein MtrunA17_Chr4g0039851 [Medicago truncatula]